MVKLRAENNKFLVTRGLLSLIGNVFIFHNRTLRILILTCYGKVMLRKEQDEGNDYDRDMIMKFMNEMKTKSDLKIFTI